MERDHGIVIYEILPFGCLNGVFAETSRELNNAVFNEILRKRSTENNLGLHGNYIAVSIDFDDSILIYDVAIREKDGKFQVLWSIDDIQHYEGTGWKTREDQLTISYRKL